MTLQEFFRHSPKAALAFSGGVDSAYLLWAAKQYGENVQAYYCKTAFQPEFELRDARRLAEELEMPLSVIELEILAAPNVAVNEPDRCYHCKRAMFAALQQKALADGYTVILDGTNASDDAGDRPGMRALQELQVRSPLRECNLAKEQIRRLSRQAGLFTWNKPAYACLATRVPCGVPITKEMLAKIQRAEENMAQMGFKDFRVRLTKDGGARIELTADEIPLAVQKREEILLHLHGEFSAVMLDLQARKKSNGGGL